MIYIIRISYIHAVLLVVIAPGGRYIPLRLMIGMQSPHAHCKCRADLVGTRTRAGEAHVAAWLVMQISLCFQYVISSSTAVFEDGIYGHLPALVVDAAA